MTRVIARVSGNLVVLTSVSLPYALHQKAKDLGINVSGVLQKALVQEIAARKPTRRVREARA